MTTLDEDQKLFSLLTHFENCKKKKRTKKSKWLLNTNKSHKVVQLQFLLITIYASFHSVMWADCACPCSDAKCLKSSYLLRCQLV